MINFWWFSLIATIIVFIIAWKCTWDVDDAVIATMKFVVGFSIIMLIVFCHAIFTESEEVLSTRVEECQIKSLKDNTSTKETSFIGGGLTFFYGKSESEDEIYYVTMVGNDQDGYLIKKFDALTTYTFYDSNDNPRYIKRYEEIKTTYQGNFVFGGIFKFNGDIVSEVLAKEELHLPEDAIEIDYNIDLE